MILQKLFKMLFDLMFIVLFRVCIFLQETFMILDHSNIRENIWE